MQMFCKSNWVGLPQIIDNAEYFTLFIAFIRDCCWPGREFKILKLLTVVLSNVSLVKLSTNMEFCAEYLQQLCLLLLVILLSKKR